MSHEEADFGPFTTGYSEQTEVYKFASVHVQHFFAAKHLARVVNRAKKPSRGFLKKQGINLGHLLALEQF